MTTDAPAAIAIDYAATTVTWTSRAPGTYDADGVAVLGGTTVSTVRAVALPITPRELRDLPEGVRAEAKVVFWSRSALDVGDTVEHGGRAHRVLRIQDRGGFVRAIASELAA